MINSLILLFFPNCHLNFLIVKMMINAIDIPTIISPVSHDSLKISVTVSSNMPIMNNAAKIAE